VIEQLDIKEITPAVVVLQTANNAAIISNNNQHNPTIKSSAVR